MLEIIARLALEPEGKRLRLCRAFFALSVLRVLAALGWFDYGEITASSLTMPLVIDLLLSTVGAVLLARWLSAITVGTCQWFRESLLPDTQELRHADPELMTTSQRIAFERLAVSLTKFDLVMGTVITGLAIMTVTQYMSGPAATAEGLVDLLGPIGCIFLLLWLAAGTLVARSTERGRYGRRLALTLLVRRTARWRKRRFLSRLPRRLVVRQYRGLRAA